MGKVNYMGGKLSVVRTCSKGGPLRIQKRHFGQQRLKTLSECLQAINNPSASIISDPVSGIRLAHARRTTARHEPGSDSSISGQRYRSYIPPPSRVSSESSDSMDAKRKLSAKIKASRMLVELARVEPVSLEYQRKRLLETPDLAGLAGRRKRIDAAKKRNASKFCVPEIISDEESETEATLSHVDISDISSYQVPEPYQDSISSWDESNIPNWGTSPVCSFSGSPVAKHVLDQNADHLKSEVNDMDSNGSDKENNCPMVENPVDQFFTSDSVILRAKQRRVSSAAGKMTIDFDPNAISMSNEWLAFFKFLDTGLHPHKMLENRKELYPHKSVLLLPDSALGLDFYVLPHLLSEKSPQMGNTAMELVPSLPPHAENVMAGSPVSALPAQLTIAQNYAHSDLASILLSCIPSPPDLCFDSIQPVSANGNSNHLAISPAFQKKDNSQGKQKVNSYDSRSQWDQLMDELLAPASSSSNKLDLNSHMNPSQNFTRSLDLKSPSESLSFRPLEMTPSDDQSTGPSNDVDKAVRTGSDKLLMNPAKTKDTRGFFTGPLLFAFTSDLESE